MIGYKHIRLAFLQIRSTLHLYRQQKYAHNKLCPPLAGIVAPEMAIAYGAANDDYNACYQCIDGYQGESYK